MNTKVPLTEAEMKLLAAAIQKKQRIEANLCFDPNKPDSRPTQKQELVFREFGKKAIQILRAGNQTGKSQTGARLVAWMLDESHPFWKRPQNWGKESLQLLVLGRNSKQIEESLYRRIRSYFADGELREVRVGNILQAVEHRKTKNKVIFQTYENEAQARERVQSYSAHFVWVDEMPHTLGLIDECLRRVQARDGYFLATFTPLVISQDVRKFCDELHPDIGSVYRLNMFDNPIYTPERQADILKGMDALPEHVRKARLEGEWMAHDNSVYYFDPATMVRAPQGYSPAWRHVESSDPAISSAHGFTLWAEDPRDGKWYLIRCEQLVGMHDPVTLVDKVKELTANVNIVRRVYDPAESWYAGMATRMGLTYCGVYKKQNRKGELIKQLQDKLGTQVFIAPWCTDFVDQVTEAHWSDVNEGKIAKGSKYHLLDSATYFCDNIPKFEGSAVVNEAWDVQLRMAWKQEREAQATKPKAPLAPMRVARRGLQGRGGRVWGR
jgi:phage terminase large subunit-like protein